MGWMLAGLLWAQVAAAGEPASLPEGEDPALWRVPFALAGLEVAPESVARIHIDVTASGWVLRARGGDGVVRTARVIAPDTPAEREEVAFLAKGLLTAIQAQQTGAPGLALTPKVPPPPPPPIAASATAPQDPPTRVPARPVPEPEPAREIPVALIFVQPEPLPPEPAPEPDDGLTLAFDPLEEVRARWMRQPEPEPEPEPRAPAVRPQRPKPAREPVRAAPVEVATGLAMRPETQAAWTVTLGMDFARLGQSHLGWHLSFLAPRRLLQYEQLLRQLQVLEWDVDLALPMTRALQVIPEAGLSYRWYRQQAAPIASGMMPVFGLRLAGVPLQTRHLALGLDGGISFDLGSTELTNERLVRDNLVPVELRANFSFRWGGGGDPFASEVTSKR